MCYKCFKLLCWLLADTEDILVLVIESLISIMDEQVDKLKKIFLQRILDIVKKRSKHYAMDYSPFCFPHSK